MPFRALFRLATAISNASQFIADLNILVISILPANSAFPLYHEQFSPIPSAFKSQNFSFTVHILHLPFSSLPHADFSTAEAPVIDILRVLSEPALALLIHQIQLR